MRSFIFNSKSNLGLFYRTWVVVLFISAPTFFISVNYFLKTKFWDNEFKIPYWSKYPSMDYRRSRLIHELSNRTEINPAIENAGEAKQRHYFWGTYDGSPNGIAIDLLRNKELFQAIFPGYPTAMAKDNELWQTYFSRDFGDQQLWVKPLARSDGHGIQVAASWAGCFDVLDKYGADVVVTGNSEAFASTVPQVLYEKLRVANIKGLENPRVLYCTVSAALPEMVREEALLLKTKLKQRVKLLIWGFSYWTGNMNYPKRDAAVRGFKKEKIPQVGTPFKADSVKHNDHNLPKASFTSLFNWNTLLPINWGSVVKFLGQGYDTNDPKNLVMAEKYLKSDLANGPYDRLVAHLNDVKPYYYFLEGIKEEDCETTRFRSIVSDALVSWLEVTDSVVLYLTPTTPYIEAAPSCFYQSIVSMMKGLASNRVFVKTEPWDKWGLSYRDYLRPSTGPELVRFDSNHTNFIGAQRVTNVLVDFISSHLKGSQFKN